MFHTFPAVVRNGLIKPLEKVKLPNSAQVLVTLVDEPSVSRGDWTRLRRWISRQKKSGKFSSYPSLAEAKGHLRRLMK